MRHIADNHKIYGNKNGIFDLEEKVAVAKEMRYVLKSKDSCIPRIIAEQYVKNYSSQKTLENRLE